jgi:hypothetical protein
MAVPLNYLVFDCTCVPSPFRAAPRANRTLGLLVILLRHFQYTASTSPHAIATLAILHPQRVLALGSTPSGMVPPSSRVTCQSCQLPPTQARIQHVFERDGRWLPRVMLFFCVGDWKGFADRNGLFRHFGLRRLRSDLAKERGRAWWNPQG